MRDEHISDIHVDLMDPLGKTDGSLYTSIKVTKKKIAKYDRKLTNEKLEELRSLRSRLKLGQ